MCAGGMGLPSFLETPHQYSQYHPTTPWQPFQNCLGCTILQHPTSHTLFTSPTPCQREFACGACIGTAQTVASLVAPWPHSGHYQTPCVWLQSQTNHSQNPAFSPRPIIPRMASVPDQSFPEPWLQSQTNHSQNPGSRPWGH